LVYEEKIMTEFFPKIDPIRYEGPDSRNPLAFKHYNPNQRILGKTMEEHLRFAVCYWHTFKSTGSDPFGGETFFRAWDRFDDPMDAAEATLFAAFSRAAMTEPDSSGPGSKPGASVRPKRLK